MNQTKASQGPAAMNELQSSPGINNLPSVTGNITLEIGTDGTNGGQTEGVYSRIERAIIYVPTKTHDGGSKKSNIVAEGVTPHDAFMLYSDGNVRMRALLGLENEEAGAANEQDNQAGHDAVEVENGGSRKTRISFEVHASKLYDMFLFHE